MKKIETSFMYKILIMLFLRTVIILVSLIAIGCKGTESQAESANSETVENICFPVKVAIIQDNTRSINWTGTPILQTDDLLPLIQLLNQCGGEIGFGLISENSNKGLIRLFINTPPVEPMEPSRKGNPYKVAQSFDIYKHDVDKFNSEFAAWQNSIKRSVDKFNADVTMSLKKNKEAHHSDVWQAIRRADLFLSENSNAWGDKPNNYALIITDGQDNVKKEKVVDMKSDAMLLMVNASGSIGDLDGLNPSMFESLASAVRYITSDVEGRN